MIKSYLSAVRHLQIANHIAKSKINKMPQLEKVIRELSGPMLKIPREKKETIPITPEILLKMS